MLESPNKTLKHEAHSSKEQQQTLRITSVRVRIVFMPRHSSRVSIYVKTNGWATENCDVANQPHHFLLVAKSHSSFLSQQHVQPTSSFSLLQHYTTHHPLLELPSAILPLWGKVHSSQSVTSAAEDRLEGSSVSQQQ